MDMSLRCVGTIPHVGSDIAPTRTVDQGGSDVGNAFDQWQTLCMAAHAPPVYGLFMVFRENLCLKLPLVYHIRVLNQH